MKLSCAQFSRRLGVLLLVACAATVLLPLRTRAQTPGSFTPLSAAAQGQASMQLMGGNAVSVTLTGVAPGAAFNVFGCTAVVSVPVAPACVIGNRQLVASASGQVSGVVAMPLSNLALAQLVVQNVANAGEMYKNTVYAGASAYGGSYGAPAGGGSTAPAGGYTAPMTTAPSSGGSMSGPGY